MSDVMDLFRDMSQLHAELMYGGRANQAFRPNADIWEEAQAYHVELDVPGIAADSLQLGVDNGVLTVQGERPAPQAGDRQRYTERRFGSYSRTFRLPQGVDTDNIEANLESGVVHITLPKRAEVQPRTIEIRVGTPQGRQLVDADTNEDAAAA